MRLTLVLRGKDADEHLTFMRQIGVQGVAANPPSDPETGCYECDALLDLKRKIESHGLKFCVGCFSEMDVDVAEEVRYFGSRGKIFFVDFRNVRGTADSFSETFPDDGKENMFEVMKALWETGYDGAISPDHALRIAGDAEGRRQYWAYAIGHMRGLLQGLDSTV